MNRNAGQHCVAEHSCTLAQVLPRCDRQGVGVVTDVYMQEMPEGVRSTVDSIHQELQGTMKKLGAKGKMQPPASAKSAAMVN
jgi:hypothetical protein